MTQAIKTTNPRVIHMAQGSMEMTQDVLSGRNII